MTANSPYFTEPGAVSALHIRIETIWAWFHRSHQSNISRSLISPETSARISVDDIEADTDDVVSVSIHTPSLLPKLAELVKAFLSESSFFSCRIELL